MMKRWIKDMSEVMSDYEAALLYDRMKRDGLLDDPFIAVIGLGGAGCNIVEEMSKKLSNVRFFCINTDQLSNKRRMGIETILIGEDIILDHKDTSGKPEIGRRAMKEKIQLIRDRILGNNDYFILITGMGGSSAYAALELAFNLHEQLLPFSVYLIKPFEFEEERNQIYTTVLQHLHKLSCRIQTFENDSLDETVDQLNRKFAENIFTQLKMTQKYLQSIWLQSFKQFVNNEVKPKPISKLNQKEESLPIDITLESIEQAETNFS